LSTHQVSTLDLIIDRYNPATIALACDRDTAGQRFNLKIVSDSKSLKQDFESFQVFYSSNKDQVAQIDLVCKCKGEENNILFMAALNNIFHDMNKKLTQQEVEKCAFYTHVKNIDKQSIHFSSDFFSTPQNWNALTQMVIKTRLENGKKWRIDLPVNKDFNRDLQMACTAYLAEQAEGSNMSFDQFVKDNYSMDGNEKSIFMDLSLPTKSKGPFLKNFEGNLQSSTNKGHSL
jgi:hypothetical protein